MNDRVIIKEFIVKTLENRKKIVRVFLPKDYNKSKKLYPVLYMHDGQNLIDKSPFSGFSWEVLKSMDEFYDRNQGFIIVGIDHDPLKRILEYSPYIPRNLNRYLNKKVGIPKNEIRPEADYYGEFIVNQLKPYIDKEYRTLSDLDNTALAGSSCGGLISIYLGLKYQDVFSTIGAFSPAYQFLPSIKGFLKKQVFNDKIRIYHDMGGNELGILSCTLVRQLRIFNKSLLKKISKKRVVMVFDKPAKHNEYYWSIRFKKFISFLYKTAL